MAGYTFFTSKELKPRGWLRRQLEIQAKGLSGNLDKIWRDIRDSAWIGGNCDGWERVPYWLDGFIPLAYLLEDEDMIARAGKYIDAILARQREDGWICPCTEEQIPTYDTWAVELISKVLVVYYECSGDERVPEALYRMMKNYYGLLSSGRIYLFNWAKERWGEGFIALNFLWKKYGEEWIRELAGIMLKQGHDQSQTCERWKVPLNQWTMETHVVNLAMMLKEEAVTSSLLPGVLAGRAERFWSLLMQYNGTPAGIFTGDECLSGLSPIQGTELCAVVELMYSCEQLFAGTGETKWLDRLERAGFNALPATLSEDMWTHQYDQMSNQIACVKFPHRPVFRTNSVEAHLFGLEPNFGCCTANFSQGFPKLALSAFFRDGDDVFSAVPMPCSLHDGGIGIEVESAYPFGHRIVYHIEAGRAFTLKVRVPAFALGVTVNGEKRAKTDVLSFAIEEGKAETIEVSFDAQPELLIRPYGLCAVKYGALLFSLPIEYEKKMYEYERDGVERKFPYCDYELYGKSEWQYGISRVLLKAETHEIGQIPFSASEPPVTVSVPVSRIEWGYEDGFDTVCAKVPKSRKATGEEEILRFIPYGAAKLRITELPLCEKEDER